MQGLRGLAVLLVVAYHAGLPLRAGFVGVDVFFVISGFVITRLLTREASEQGRIRFGRFYRRRVRRLLPALALMTSVTLILSALLQSPIGAQRDTAIVGFGASLWAANGAIWEVTHGYFGAAPESLPLLHTWSLAVEEQFYLVFPALTAAGLLIGGWIRRRREAGVVLVVGLVTLGSFGVSLVLSYTVGLFDAARGLAFLGAPTRAWEFGVGALVALRPLRTRPIGRPLGSGAGILGVVLMVGAAALLRTPLPFPGVGAIPPVVGAALALWAGHLAGTPANRILSSRLLVHLGDLSYSWYLWHWPLVAFAALLFDERVIATVLAAALSYPIARLSYSRVEQPFRQREPTRRLATVRLVTACVSVPLLLAGGLLVGASANWGRADIEALADQLTYDMDEVPRDCLSQTRLSRRDLTECTVRGAANSTPVLLLGDSNAWQFADPVVRAARSLDRTVGVATIAGCSLLDVEVRRTDGAPDFCRRWYEDAMVALRGLPELTLVLASANRYIENDDFQMRAPSTTAWASRPAAKAALWEAGLTRTLTELTAMGHEVLQVTVLPHLYRSLDDHVPWSARQCPFPELLRDTSDCGISRPRSVVDHDQRYALAAERGAAAAAGVPELDLRDVVCDRSRCTTNRGTTRLLTDGFHLTPAAAQTLTPRFVAALDALRTA